MGPTEYVSPTPSPEDRNRSSFGNVFFIIIDDGQNPRLNNYEYFYGYYIIFQ
jgi:hypothetical protein